MEVRHSHPPGALSFDVKEESSPDYVQRLGKLSFRGHGLINTPHYLPVTSRGCVPHLSQDVMWDMTRIKGVYLAFEDFIDKDTDKALPIYKVPVTSEQSRLRQFISLQKDALVVLGPRRHPPVPARAANTNTSIVIQSSVGFSSLESDDYVEAAQKLKPDIILGMADYEHLKIPGAKRLEKMGDRTLAWTQDMISGLRDGADGVSDTAFFAPLLPIEVGNQSEYLGTLQEELAGSVSGWTIFDSASIDAIPPAMCHLPRLAMTTLRGPHDVLNQISLGLDIFIPAFIGEATDAGMALTFTFPSPKRPQNGQPLVLSVTMWSDIYISDLSPLVESCKCYTCENHHRAYVRHLLDAKEMLAWVLLQIHNYHMVDVFFDGVRQSMSNNTFESDSDTFEKSYEQEFSASRGQGPRLRGYQVKSGPAEPRRNPPAFRSLEDASNRLADSILPSPGADGEDLERQGFADKLV